jgi:DNA-binding MarR family transcriptional regulator
MSRTSKPASVAIPEMHRRVPQYLARRFWQVCSNLQSEAYSAYGLMPWQFAILIQLRNCPGKDRNWHAGAVGADATSVGQTLDRWVAEGIVQREVNPEDRRASAYALTAKGQDVLTALLPRSRAVTAQLLAPLSETESNTLLTLLACLVEAHEAHARPGAGRRSPRRTRPPG